MAISKSLTIAEAKALATEWEHRYAQHEYDTAIAVRFRDATPAEVIAMWESGKNERGQKLNSFEFAALVEKWCDLFHCLPPDEEAGAGNVTVDQQPTLQEQEPEDDTMLRMADVVRLAGVSESTIKRMVLDGRFPKPMRLSRRSIGWPARDVKVWLRQVDDQRRASRQ
jgi:prophage regulatory protein